MNNTENCFRTPPARKNIFTNVAEPMLEPWKRSSPKPKTDKINPNLLLACIQNAVRNIEDMIETVEELLATYPNLIYNKEDPVSCDLWRDIIKAATPKNLKRKKLYDAEAFETLMEAELRRLVNVRNSMVHARMVMGESCSKVLLLKIVGEMENSPQPYTLGSGSRPDTRRLILMYEAEANVTPKTRNRVNGKKRSNSDADAAVVRAEVGPSMPAVEAVECIGSTPCTKRIRSFFHTESFSAESGVGMVPIVSCSSSSSIAAPFGSPAAVNELHHQMSASYDQMAHFLPPRLHHQVSESVASVFDLDGDERVEDAEDNGDDVDMSTCFMDHLNVTSGEYDPSIPVLPEMDEYGRTIPAAYGKEQEDVVDYEEMEAGFRVIGTSLVPLKGSTPSPQHGSSPVVVGAADAAVSVAAVVEYDHEGRSRCSSVDFFAHLDMEEDVQQSPHDYDIPITLLGPVE